VKAFEATVVAAGAIYLVVLGWAMQSLSYDIWGALVVTPVLALISIPLINRAFADDLAPLRPWVWAGLALKFVGAIAGYFVRFDVYGGSADAGRYHAAGKMIAGQFRDGTIGILGLIPTSTGTPFIEEFTGLVYAVTGTSRMGGFMVFAWMSFWGLVFFVKAAHHAIGDLATRRYAIAVFFFPSLVYWGSSIGKEAFVGLCLGVSAYGASLVLTRRGSAVRGFVLLAIGLVGTGYVRPHFAAIWAGAVLIALVARVVLDSARRSDRSTDERRRSQLGTVVLLAVAGIGFVIVAQITLSFLDPANDAADEVAEEEVTDRLSSIFDRVEDRTNTGGSSFTPISINGPQDWPLAAFRTLTRPFLFEVTNLQSALPAIEMTALLLVGVVSWRRLAHAPRLMLTTPYLVFAALCVVTFGVAFASIGNLGILTRQRSLVLPLLLVFWCLPPIVFASERARAEIDARTGRPRPRLRSSERTPTDDATPHPRALTARGHR
jgi:hypothetical protein